MFFRALCTLSLCGAIIASSGCNAPDAQASHVSIPIPTAPAVREADPAVDAWAVSVRLSSEHVASIRHAFAKALPKSGADRARANKQLAKAARSATEAMSREADRLKAMKPPAKVAELHHEWTGIVSLYGTMFYSMMGAAEQNDLRLINSNGDMMDGLNLNTGKFLHKLEDVAR